MMQQAPDSFFTRLQQSDQKVLDEYYRLFSDGIYLLAYRLLSDEGEARDAMVEAFHSLWINRAELMEPKSVQGFLVTTTRNRCIDLLRKRKSRKFHLEQASKGQADISALSPDKNMLYAETIALICREVQKLPSQNLRDVFILRFIEQKEPAEVAEILSLTIKKVYNYTDEARRKIRNALNNSGVDLLYIVVMFSLSMNSLLQLMPWIVG